MKHEAFTKLVAEMRAAEKRYWQGGRQHNDLTKAIYLESQVDKEIKRVADILQSHPESQPGNESPQWKFFCLVTCLRSDTQKYFALKKVLRYKSPQERAASQGELNELWTSVTHYEAEIDRMLNRISDAEKRALGYTITFQVIRSRANMREPQVMLTTQDENYANAACYDYNNKSKDGSIYGVRRIEQQPQQKADNPE